MVTAPVDDLRDPLGDGWAFGPIDRMTELLRTAKAIPFPGGKVRQAGQPTPSR